MNSNEMIFEVYESDAWSTLTVIDGLGQTFALDVQRWHTELLHDDTVVLGSVVDVRRTGNVFTFVDGNRSRVNVVALRWYDTTSPTVDVPQPTAPQADPYEWDDDDDLERMQDALAGDWSRIEDGSTGCSACDGGNHGMITHDGKCACCGIALAYYVVLQTAAPQAYDYAYTVQVGEDDGLRYVAVPNGVQAYQTDRYLSGMYGVDRIGACYNPSDWEGSGDFTSPF